MRFTRTGVAAVVAAVALVIGSRAFGLLELFVMGVAVAALVVVTALWVRLRRVDVVVARTIRPTLVHAGDQASVAVVVHNRGRTSPILAVHDPVTRTRGADLMFPPQHPRADAKASYRLPTGRRGLVEIGPMTVTIADPFGLWRTTRVLSGRDEVIVLPALVDIPPMDRTTGPDPDSGVHRGSIGHRGDDFAALRSYVVGDDLRRVHWPSSARTDDDLLVRTADVPWHGRIVVVLDMRPHVHDDVVVEHAVTAAASVLRAHVHRGDLVRLVSTSGYDSGFDTGGAHLGAVLERLAVMDVGANDDLHATLERAGHGGGAFVTVSGRPTVDDVTAVDVVAPTNPARRLVCFAGDDLAVTDRGTLVVSSASIGTFAEQWTRAGRVRVGRKALR